MASLADLQRAPGATGPAAAARLPLAVDRVRTFDTPEFAGMTFLEVEAKSALNRVSGMPFSWSVNPYRGCSHACSYCAAGDTPVLMADGRTRPLAEIRPGDAIVGTRMEGSCRRYVVTEVLDHWQTVKPAFRTILEDGTSFVTSGDHRFLSDRGWKYVTGTECGASRRPHLTENNRLLGPGAFPDPPKHCDAYERGYLAGMILGHGHVRSYPYTTPGGRTYTVNQFRLALADAEGLDRARTILESWGISTQELVFQQATNVRQEVQAIRTQSAAGVAAISELIKIPTAPAAEWYAGFLAGIYDAEGGYSHGILRITNKDAHILQLVRAGLAGMGLRYVDEQLANGCTNIRVVGGLPEHLRFFLATDPAITRKRTFDGAAVKNGLPRRVASVKPLGFRVPLYDITTGTGDYVANGVISHNCFARPTHAYLNLSPLGDFEKTVVVKTNVVEVLRRELARKSWKGEHVAMGTNTDPYQRCEGRYQLMPGIIDTFAQGRTPFSILTKGTLITRDVDRLTAAAEVVPVTAAMTIGMLDERVWRSSEPGTPSPLARLAAVRKLNDAGIPTGIMLAPIMPGLNDDPEQLAALVDASAAAGATHITPIVLHLRPGVREVFWPWLEEHHPDLVNTYEVLYRRTEASKDYRDEVTKFVAEQRKIAWRRHGGPANGVAPRPLRAAGEAPARAPAPTGEQLSLL